MGKGHSAPPAPAPPQVIQPDPQAGMTEIQKALQSQLGGMMQNSLSNSGFLNRPLSQNLPQNPNPQALNFPQFDPQAHAQAVQQQQGPGLAAIRGTSTWRGFPPSPGAGGGKALPPSPGAGGGKAFPQQTLQQRELR